MTFDEANTVVAKVKYKSKCRFGLSKTSLYFGGRAETEAWMLRLFVTVPDSAIPGNWVELNNTRIISGEQTASTLVHQMFSLALDMESHECCEFFRYDGVPIFNPHSNVNALRAALALEPDSVL